MWLPVTKRLQLLIDLTNRFYQTVFAEFHQSRQAAWEGWCTVLGLLHRQRLLTNKVFWDVGCGNGRFARILVEYMGSTAFSYVGIDSNKDLLNIAKSGLTDNTHIRWRKLDVLQQHISDLLNKQKPRPDIITAFGVFHHVPGRLLRRAFWRMLCEQLQPGGVVIVTFWHPDRLPIWGRQVAPAEVGLPRNILETGDALLPWGDVPNVARFCHAYTSLEIRNIIKQVPGRVLAQFDADGRTGDSNTYVVFQVGTDAQGVA